MHTLRRAPKRTPSVGYLCTQCRHATTKTATKTAKHRLTLKSTARDLAERSATLRERVHSARQGRREDWLLGPLAPDRAAADPVYGCVSARELEGVKGLQRTRQGRSPYMAPEVRYNESLVEVGDRVVVVAKDGPASRERGKMGKVNTVRMGQGECVVEDLNLADIAVPPSFAAIEPNTANFRTIALPLPLSAVRVVCEMTHPDGITCDTIIDKMVRLPNKPGRYIANSNRATGEWQKVPERKRAKKALKEPKAPKEKKAFDADTLRFEVEEATWTPTLLRAPMPGGVIDELRNKYSKYRTRHEPRYQLALDNRERRKAEWKAWAASGGTMLSSPAREAAAKARDERAALPKPTLKAEILEKIGEVMAGKGIELTPARKKEMECNLRTEAVVGAGAVVESDKREVVKRKAEIVTDRDAAVDMNRNMTDAMEKSAIDQMAIEEAIDQRRINGR